MAYSVSPSRQLAEELEQTRRDLESKEDLLLLTKKDNERLRLLMKETRDEFHEQVEQFAGEKAAADARLMEAKLEAERERSNRRDVQRELEEAIGERERQIRSVSDVRKQVDGKLNRLVDEIHNKDRTLQELQSKLAVCEKEQERLKSFETLYHNREEQLHTVLGEYNTLQSDHTKLCSLNAQLEGELESMRIVRERELSAPPPMPSLAALSPQPPQTQPANQATVDNTAALLLPSQLSFTKDVSKDLSQFSELAESLYDDLSDLKIVLNRGTSGSADLIGAQSQDRKRIASMRKMQSALSGSKSGADGDVEEMRALMLSTREGQARMHTTLSGLCEFSKELRAIVDRHCTVYGGLEAMHNIVMHGGGGGGGERTPTRPQPWPHQGDTTPPAEGHHHQPHQPPPQPQQVHRQSSFSQHNGAALTQMNDALMAKEKELSATKMALVEAEHKCDLSDASVKRLEAQVERMQVELTQSRAREEEETKRNRELQTELMDVNGKTRDEREKHLSVTAETLRKHEEALRSVQREADLKIRELEQSHDTEMRQLAVKVDDAMRQKADLAQKETRFGQELDKNKERLANVKQQRDELVAEIKELKSRLVSAANELRHYQLSAAQMSEELDCYKSAEQFARQQQETSLVEDVDDGVWSEWKNNQKVQQAQAARAAPSIHRSMADGNAAAATTRRAAAPGGSGVRSGSLSSVQGFVTPVKIVRSKQHQQQTSSRGSSAAPSSARGWR